MSSRRWQLRVEDILQAISAIQQRTNGLTFAAFQRNDMLVESVLYKFIVIGEASANIPEGIQSRHPEVPWRLMSDMRNIIAHEYFRVNLTIVWGTLQNNLPLLIEPLQRLLASEADNEL
ncbi:HepT-like ribonuclease domain-containing protein [Coleofasciculus sp.]|uniref:HepT-like ribonuclease domain-containing protein n=1 Tax=Coleofasciculus sp. TaxID=3100458 RepID=UPI003A24228D